MANLSREECLALDIKVYNVAVRHSWAKHKKDRNLSGDLHTCEHCTRLFAICCICDVAEKRWANSIDEVQRVSESNARLGDGF